MMAVREWWAARKEPNWSEGKLDHQVVDIQIQSGSKYYLRIVNYNIRAAPDILQG